MQIERNLLSPLRSMIERVVEAKDEFASTQVQVDKDKGQSKQEQNLKQGDRPEQKLEENPEVAENVTSEDKPKPVVAHRIDLIA